MKQFTRRHFLTVSTVASGSLLLPFNCESSPRQFNEIDKKEKVGVALLGLGSYSTYQLAPALQQTKHAYLAGIVTGSPEKIPVWQRKYGIPDTHVYNYNNMSDIANNKDIDVIYIVTPTGTHAKFAVAAANTGKHVWCEKPMAMTVEECQTIIDACQKNKVKLSIGYRMQHEPNTQTLIGYANSKPFGKLTRIDALAGYNGGGGNNWRFKRDMGGGALYDMGVYTINGIRYSAGMEPTRVISAEQTTKRPRIFAEVDETTAYVLEFKNGLKAYGRTSVGENINQLKVSCENGSYQLSPMQSYNGVVGSRSDGKKLNTFIANQQAKQMDDDARSILDNKTVMVSGEEGLKDIHIVQAIIKSAETKQAVVL